MTPPASLAVMPRLAATAFAALTLVVALAGCGGGDETPATTAATTATEEASETGAVEPPGLTGVVWEWQGSSYNDDSEAVPDDPAQYTIEFADDGTAIIQADCNQVRAEYTADESTMTITPGPSTKVACPEGSLDSRFLLDLEGAATYAVESGELRIDIKFDTGSMRFAPAG